MLNGAASLQSSVSETQHLHHVQLRAPETHTQVKDSNVERNVWHAACLYDVHWKYGMALKAKHHIVRVRTSACGMNKPTNLTEPN